VTVAYGAEPWLEQAVDRCLASSGVDVEVVVVDNGCTDGTVDRLDGRTAVTVVRPGQNTGFAAGCNVGVAAARNDVVALVNPDALVEPDALARLAEAALRPEVGIATASIRLADQPELLNSAGNEIHCTGLSWSGSFEEKAVDHATERQAIAASGCCMAMRRDRWDELGGFEPMFFAYYEDADLSVRAWQRGWEVRYIPDAVVLHRYEFSRRKEKYFLLERNRVLLVSTCYSRRMLLVLSPLLLAMECGFVALALYEGWIRQKFASWGWLVQHRREIVERRQRVQAARRVGDHELVDLFSDDLLPGNYDLPKAWPHVNRLVRAYWRLVKRRI
jgi:GT2 family glycosyltransferase